MTVRRLDISSLPLPGGDYGPGLSETEAEKKYERATFQGREYLLNRVSIGTSIHVIGEDKIFFLKGMKLMRGDELYDGMYMVKTINDKCFVISPSSIMIFDKDY